LRAIHRTNKEETMTKKKMTESVSNVGASNVHADPVGPVGGGDPLPTEQAPVPPSTSDAPLTRVEARRGLNPTAVQVQAAPRAAEELRTSQDKFTEIFGVRVPGPTTVANALEYSAGWSTALAAARRWTAYCAVQNRAAWEHSLGLIERLQPIAQAPGSTAEADLPELTSVITSRSVSGKRGAATRKANKAAEAAKAAKAAAKAAQASATSATTAVTTATPVTTVTTVDPATAVTK
jgi:hypothetical protein